MQRRNQQSAASLHMEYRTSADKAAQVYSDLRTNFPLGGFPKHAARMWRLGMLAEVWGIVATRLSGGRVDYLENWRTGQ